MRHAALTTRGVRCFGLVVLFILAAGVAGETQRGPLTATRVPTTIVTGALKDATVYTLVKPDNWNGTVFVDLDHQPELGRLELAVRAGHRPCRNDPRADRVAGQPGG